MNPKLMFGVVFLITFAFYSTSAIRCFSCSNPSSCKIPKSVECNKTHAIETTQYLSNFFQNVSTDALDVVVATCMQQETDTKYGKIQFKGCIYTGWQTCNYTLKPQYQPGDNYFCNICQNRDGCNPADRMTISLIAIVLTSVLGLISKILI
ncbi:uncharacterized protein LOC129910835 [Episyrphus balteatus]|uniref:uncharacterized protein LOC129910835 n=1 Tax=Episyrphus balteatus TaxID=286459 RepID=UPI0024862B22|nr:uncharacterized protein LOC129910835 [Episyrphus balteatus]